MVHVVGELRDKHQSKVSQLLGTRGPEVVGNARYRVEWPLTICDQ